MSKSGPYEGFVINPFGENILIDRDMMETIQYFVIQMDKGEKVMIGVPSEYPDEMIAAVQKRLRELDGVMSAYLLLMIRNDHDQSFLMVIETEEETNPVFAQIAETATPFLKKDQKLDFITLQEPFGQSAVKGQSPFYRREPNRHGIAGWLKGLWGKR